MSLSGAETECLQELTIVSANTRLPISIPSSPSR